MLKGVNWIAVILAVIVQQVVGYVWYEPLFGKAWVAALGYTPSMDGMAMKMSLGVVNTLVIAVGLAWLIGRLGARSLGTAVGVALAAWFFFDFTTMAVDYLYVGHTKELVAINMGYQLVCYALVGAILGLMKPKAAA